MGHRPRKCGRSAIAWGTVSRGSLYYSMLHILLVLLLNVDQAVSLVRTLSSIRAPHVQYFATLQTSILRVASPSAAGFDAIFALLQYPLSANDR